jgi:uncharacterized membrane protein
MTSKRLIERGLFYSIVLLFIVGLGINIHALIVPVAKVPWDFLVILYAAISYAHANYMLGHARAHALLVITVMTAATFELIGLKTGIIFGPYMYSTVLEPQLFGLPVVVPFAYFMMGYPCLVISNLLLYGRPVADAGGPVWRLWVAVFAAMLLTAWDLTMDPLMSTQPGAAWIWTDGGPYFGVPLRNFAGWMLTATVMYYIYRTVERRLPHAPVGNYSKRLLLLVPVLCYAILAIADSYIGGAPQVRLISPFVMGIPAVAAIMEVLRPDDDVIDTGSTVT